MTNAQKVAWMAMCLCTGASARMFLNERPVQALDLSYRAVASWMFVMSPLIFLFSAVRVFINARVAVIASLIAALLALPHVLLLERMMRQSGLSWWLSFNLPSRQFGGLPSFAPWLILTLVSSTFVLLLAITKLLPATLIYRGVRLNQRTWPAFAVTLVLLCIWYLKSVSPYRVPMIVDASSPEVSVLHVIKRGLAFSDANIKLHRDGRAYRATYTRHYFQYGFPTKTSIAVVSPGVIESFRKILAEESSTSSSEEFRKLRAWNDDGWYVLGQHRKLAFTRENGRQVPPEIVALFEEVNGIKAIEEHLGEERDICGGFCYDPWAGLGIIYANQRCRWHPGDNSHAGGVYDCF